MITRTTGVRLSEGAAPLLAEEEARFALCNTRHIVANLEIGECRDVVRFFSAWNTSSGQTGPKTPRHDNCRQPKWPAMVSKRSLARGGASTRMSKGSYPTATWKPDQRAAAEDGLAESLRLRPRQEAEEERCHDGDAARPKVGDQHAVVHGAEQAAASRGESARPAMSMRWGDKFLYECLTAGHRSSGPATPWDTCFSRDGNDETGPSRAN